LSLPRRIRFGIPLLPSMLPSAVKVNNLDDVRSESRPEDEEQGVVVSASMVGNVFLCQLSLVIFMARSKVKEVI
jgi:hypothetical protein